MGRGPVVANRKGAQSAKKGKIFSLHAKMIALAAAKGADPDQNPSLAEAIHKAHKDNVPNDTVKKAIARGSGADKDAANIEQVVYEWYGAGGVAVVVEALTDNRNRTATNIRTIFNKNNGNLGDTGSVTAFLFEVRGIIEFTSDRQDIEELIFEVEADDYDQNDTNWKVITSKEGFASVKKKLEESGLEIEEAKLGYVPKNEIEVTDFENGVKLVGLLSALDEDEDVQHVYSNGVIDDTMMSKIDEAIEARRFKT